MSASQSTIRVPAGPVLAAPPQNPAPERFYLFYLHGAIVEGSDGRPVSPEYGPYEYLDIVRRFAEAGFVTISEIREKGADVESYADRVVGWIDQLLAAGVPPGRITVVGASRGGVIASHVSHRLKNEKVKFVFLAGLFASLVEKAGVELYGEVLSIYDEADVYTVSPEVFFAASGGITRSESLVTRTGLGHGLLYRAYPEWFEATVAWSGIQGAATDSSGTADEP